MMSLDIISYGKVTWTNIEQPTPEDIEVLRRNYDFHPLDLEDCLSRIERPKIDEYEDYLFIVMHFPVYDKDAQVSKPSEVDFFIGSGYLVTVHDGILKPICQLFDDCQHFKRTCAKHMGRGASRLLYDVIDALVDYCFPILSKVDANIEEIEEDIFTEDMRRIVRKISIVRRDVIALRRIIRPQIAIVTNLEQKDRPFIREELDVYFGDIVDHLNKAWDILEDYREVIEGLSDTSETVTSYRINEVMKMLAIVTLTFSFLEATTGIFGMNLAYLPLASRPYAFFVLTGLMLLTIVGMLFYFRRQRWL